MNGNQKQGQLFQNQGSAFDVVQNTQEICLTKTLLINWQESIQNHQAKYFEGRSDIPTQGSFFETEGNNLIENFQPLSLMPLPLSFWRWPRSPHDGPAIYLVMDRLEDSKKHILLYIGETVAADRRWKGDHDCKAYLSAYSEALVNASIKCQLSIRFWSDVPEQTHPRRKLEQQLIQKWLPPFNKETRTIWKTPFTAEIH